MSLASYIINKLLPVKITDSDLRENPFKTEIGQEVVGVQESFWSRKLRYGRPAYNNWEGTAITGGTFNTFQFFCNRDTVFTPSLITFSADVDVTHIKITYLPVQNYKPYNDSYGANVLAQTQLKAGQSLMIKLDGEVSVSYPAGFIGIQVVPASTGKMYACVHGIETPINV